MDSQTLREQFVIDTYKRLQPGCDAHIEAVGAIPLICLVTTTAGAGRYEVAGICDRYALNVPDKADEMTAGELEKDGVWVGGESIPVSASHKGSKHR